MQIRKYQNSGKLGEEEIHVNIEPVTITPEPWQYIMRDEFLKDMDGFYFRVHEGKVYKE